jgi:FixJ family two-component response regulator
MSDDTDDVPHQPIRPLTPKQELVVAGLCRGWNNARIGASMGIQASTVKQYLDSIDDLFSWSADPDVPKRERIRLWGLFRLWEKQRARRSA